MLEQAKPVTVNISNAKIEDALETCFANQPFSYEMEGLTVIVTLKKPLAVAATVADITGVVTDENNNAIESASVINQCC